jgi:molybdate transport system substrate-binding protein
VVLLAALLVACGSPSVPPTTITVSVAASLTGTFTDLAQQFEAGHPDVQVRLNLGPSTDAALVFLTDIRATHGTAQAVDFPAARTAVISYPIAAISRSPHPEPAREFLAMVTGPAGRQTFAEAGFGPP